MSSQRTQWNLRGISELVIRRVRSGAALAGKTQGEYTQLLLTAGLEILEQKDHVEWKQRVLDNSEYLLGLPKEGMENATEIREIEEGSEREYPHGNACREAPEAGGCDCDEEGGEIEA